MIDILDNLPDAAFAQRAMGKGEAVFRQDETTHSLVQVNTGTVHLVRHTEHGHEIILHRAAAGSLVAEASLFSTHYHCDCIATEPSKVTLISAKAVRSKMTYDADFAADLLARFAGEIMALRRRLEIIAIPKAGDRVYAAVASGMHTGTIRALASQIHLTPEATNRALSDLCKAGKLKRVSRGRYRIKTQ